MAYRGFKFNGQMFAIDIVTQSIQEENLLTFESSRILLRTNYIF
jgi:hypothetical protein